MTVITERLERAALTEHAQSLIRHTLQKLQTTSNFMNKQGFYAFELIRDQYYWFVSLFADSAGRLFDFFLLRRT